MQTNDQFNHNELSVLLRELRRVIDRGVAGDIVELGCYKGLTSLEIQKTLDAQLSNKRLYLYDSFAGLPPKAAQDNSPVGMQFKAGELPATKSEVIKLFKKSGLTVPYIKKAWFSELTTDDLPRQVAFAFLDGDFYESIMNSLQLVWPRLTTGAVVLVDDYQNEALPGAAKAVTEWLKSHQATIKVEASLAILHKA